MKRFLLLALIISGTTIYPAAARGGKKKFAAKASAVTVDTTAIQWMTLDEVQTAMAKQPRKVIMDVYTDWCGWCKVMDKKTFSNPAVIRYVNENFYAVKLNAEAPGSVRFMGKMYEGASGANALASELMKGRMSYPTTVIMEESFGNPQPVPGYLDVPTFETILKYFGGNVYKTTPFEEFRASYKTTWAVAP